MRNALPEKFNIDFRQFDNAPPVVRVYYNGRQIGNELNDNSRIEDGYRYHDAFHFCYLVHTGQLHVIDALISGADTKSPEWKKKCLFEEIFSLMSFKARYFPLQVDRDMPRKSFVDLMSDLSKIIAIEYLQPEMVTPIVTDFYRNFDLLYKNKGGTLICDTALKTIQYQP